MSNFERVSSVQEEFGANALLAIIPGVILIGLGGLLFVYRSALSTLGIVLIVIGVGLVGWGVFQLKRIREVTTYAVDCPFCEAKNTMTQVPEDDFRCDSCQRLVPVLNGVVLEVFQVRCGFCNHLNYYSSKSTGLICENCDRAIPIATDEDVRAKKVFETYTARGEDAPHDLVLTESPKSEEMITCLQHMLALNRNQVKQLLDELPQVLLQGIPRKKAELLSAQLSMHKGTAEIKPSQTNS